jgi:hypothetical protein
MVHIDADAKPRRATGLENVMQSVDGLWSAEFGTLNGWTNGGVIMLDKGRLLGGGEHYYCVGRFDLRGHVFTAEARCSHFHGPTMNAFGHTLPIFYLTVKGRLVGDFIDGEMHQSDQPGQKLPFRLVWRAGLPDAA